MNVLHIERLNETFSLENGASTLRFKTGKGGLPTVDIRNEQARAKIGLQGAHVLSWIPAAEDEVVWMSDQAVFAPARSLRGGIPVCWPWFGAHESNITFPAHGFARTVLWQVVDTRQLVTGETQITFKLDTRKLDETIRGMWPQATIAEYRLTVGHTLSLELTTFNYSDQPITLSQALHTYFAVDEVTNTTVIGLENKDYLDKTDDFKRKLQIGPVIVSTQLDRVYLQTANDVFIDNGKRRIIIRKKGSQSTVVWNPWKDVAEKMGDLGKDGYLKMLCVESANTAGDRVSIGVGESHVLQVRYEIEGI